MACENDKCEKYGLHHDYKDGIEIRKCFACEKDDQPERSKREDSVLNNIPEYGSQSSLNFEEWQRRCGALNTKET